MNKDIFETVYYHGLKASCELAAKEGPYVTYYGSPVSKVSIFSYHWCFYFFNFANCLIKMAENGLAWGEFCS